VEKVRELVFYRHYFQDFFDRQTEKVKEKIDYALFLIAHVEHVPEKFLKHIEGQKGLYEIRVEAGGSIFRIFCCFDKGKIIVLFNGFQKKSQKTPRDEIKMAVKLMGDYFNNK
jgi:phage-related protein